MLGIYLGRRQASVIPKKKEYLTKRKFGQHDGILDTAGREDSEKFRFSDFYDFITASYFETTNKYFSGAAEYAPWLSLPTAKVAAEGQVSDACEGGKYQFIHQPYNPDANNDPAAKWVMEGLPPSKIWPTIEVRTVVRAVGAGQKLAFYQHQEADAYRPIANINPTNEHSITAAEWPTIENGMAIGAGQIIVGSEVFTNGAGVLPYEEFINRIGRTRSNSATPVFANETERSPLVGSGRAYAIDKIVNELFWTSALDGLRADGAADTRKKPKGFQNL